MVHTYKALDLVVVEINQFQIGGIVERLVERCNLVVVEVCILKVVHAACTPKFQVGQAFKQILPEIQPVPATALYDRHVQLKATHRCVDGKSVNCLDPATSA